MFFLFFLNLIHLSCWSVKINLSLCLVHANFVLLFPNTTFRRNNYFRFKYVFKFPQKTLAY